jgi:hypothetical protein
MVGRAGIWSSDPDLIAFAALVEELAARGPPAVPRGHRFGVGLTGAAYYHDREVWAADPRPDIVAFRALVTELQQRQQAETEECFVTRLRARLAEIASLSIVDRRMRVGVADEYLEVALAGGRVPARIAERLQAFLASEPA